MTGLRERKKATTRLALRQAATDLCVELGPAAVTVDAVCARAGVSARTFFNYFASKDDAILGWTDDDGAQFVDDVVARPAGEDPLTAVQAALADLVGLTTSSALWHTQLDLMRRHPELLARSTAASRRIELSIAEAVARRTGRNALDPAILILAAASTAALRVALARWLDSAEGTDARTLLAEAVDSLRGGLALP